MGPTHWLIDATPPLVRVHTIASVIVDSHRTCGSNWEPEPLRLSSESEASRGPTRRPDRQLEAEGRDCQSSRGPRQWQPICSSHLLPLPTGRSVWRWPRLARVASGLRVGQSGTLSSRAASWPRLIWRGHSGTSSLPNPLPPSKHTWGCCDEGAVCTDLPNPVQMYRIPDGYRVPISGTYPISGHHVTDIVNHIPDIRINIGYNIRCPISVT